MTTIGPDSSDLALRGSEWRANQARRGATRPYLCHLSGKQYWEPVGQWVEVWTVLGPRIRAVFEDLALADWTLSVHMVMIGETQQTSQPHVLICAEDRRLREAVGSHELFRNIMVEYSAIGIDFSPNAPEHLASDDLSASSSQDCSTNPPVVDWCTVWGVDAQPKMGNRFHTIIPGGAGGFRESTGGPIFYTNSNSFMYQSMVKHVLSIRSTAPPPHLPQSSFDLDLELDPSEDGGSCSDQDSIVREAEPEHIPTSETRSSESAADGLLGASVYGLDGEQPDSEGNGTTAPKRLDRVGSIVRETVIGPDRSLDYALVEMQVGDEDDPNLVCYDPCDGDKRVRVTEPGYMSDIDSGASVVVITSLGPVSGKLSTTPALIKSHGQCHFDEVYPVTVDDGQRLQPGDCGSAVIGLKKVGETVNGRIFGHVVFGHPGSRVVYILSMGKIIKDMAKVLKLEKGQYLSLQPKKYMERGSRTEHHVSNQFSSPGFYENLTREPVPKRNGLLRVYDRLRVKAGSSKPRKPKAPRVPKIKPGTFENWFFSFPAEIRDEIVTWLDFRSAMNLRQVSRRWRSAVSVNGSAISRRFLVKNPLPPLALQLYPHQSSDSGLAHIERVGHCHAVASRLAGYMATWLTDEIYLRDEPRLRMMNFQAMKLQIKRRLVPSLFLLGHFFQKYPQALLDSMQEDSSASVSQQEENASISQQHGSVSPSGLLSFTGIPFERFIMEDYRSKLIQQARDVMLILVTFLRRRARPPSKYGRFQRTLHHYLEVPLSDRELATVLCIGGLDAVVACLDAGSYNKNVLAVRDCVARLSRPQVEPRPSTSVSSSAISLGPILPLSVPLELIWRPTAEALLRERGIFERFNNYPQVLRELIQEGPTKADELYGEGHDLWHALFDKEIRGSNPPPEA